MPVILLTNSYSEKPLTVIKSAIPEGFKLICLEQVSKEDLIRKAQDADYFLVSGRLPIDKEVIESAKKLKMVQRTGVGIDTIDFKTLEENNIPIYINFGINTDSVAEHTILLMLSVLRQLPLANANVKMGRFDRRELGLDNVELKNKTIGLVGLGKIGRRVAELLIPFGVNVLYFKRSRLSHLEEDTLQVTYCAFSDLLRNVDILSLHCSLNEETIGLIGSKELAIMKSGAIIINTSRGRLIDEEALIDYLLSGHIKAAGLDVFSEEPISPENPLIQLENVVLTPHFGGITSDSFRRMMSEAMENIRLFNEGDLQSIEDKRLRY